MVWVWGSYNDGLLGNSNTQQNKTIPAKINGLDNIIKIDSGDVHSLVLKEDGTLWAWGSNSSGQLGNGSTKYSSTPIQVSKLDNVSDISAGDYHSLAVKNDGTVWAWGENQHGQLGLEDVRECNIPQQIGLKNISNVNSGRAHSVALEKDGTVWAWGDNAQGQIGDGNDLERFFPVQVEGLNSVVAISAGYEYCLALTSDNKLWGWGDGREGQLGTIHLIDNNTIPAQVTSLNDIITISAGEYHSLALKGDGTVWAWGNNTDGQLGHDSYDEYSDIPVKVDDLTDVTMIAAGDNYSLAVVNDDELWTWGHNVYEEIEYSRYPVEFASFNLDNIDSIAAGESHVLTSIHGWYLKAWGDNWDGQLGDGTNEFREEPIIIAFDADIDAIAAGYTHSLTITEDGKLWGWGNNYNGQLGIGDEEETNEPVEIDLYDIKRIFCGEEYSLFLDEAGNVWGSGKIGFEDRDEINTNEPVELNFFDSIEITGGYEHWVALRENGQVYSYGRNSKGQLGDGSLEDRIDPVMAKGLSDVIEISAGQYHTLALKDDGTVWSWGDNYYGQLGTSTRCLVFSPRQIFLPQEFPTTICFDYDSYSTPIPKEDELSKQVKISAKVLNELEKPIENTAIVYSLEKTYEGIDIDTKTGVVTVTPQAAAGTVVVKASYEGLTVRTNLLLIEWIPYTIVFDVNKYKASIPEESSEINQVIVNAIVLNKDEIPLEDMPISYSLSEEYIGVTIDDVTGAITVTSQAEPGTAVIIASYDTLTATVELQLLSGALNNLMTVSATAGKSYDFTVIGNRISDLNDMEVTLNYDTDIFELTDLSSFTKPKELGKGVIKEMDITVTIVDVASGEVRFKVDKDIPNNGEWNGVLNAMRFRAKTTGEGTVSITQ